MNQSLCARQGLEAFKVTDTRVSPNTAWKLLQQKGLSLTRKWKEHGELYVEITLCTEHTDPVKNIDLYYSKIAILANVILLTKCALDLSEQVHRVHSHVRDGLGSLSLQILFTYFNLNPLLSIISETTPFFL